MNVIEEEEDYEDSKVMGDDLEGANRIEDKKRRAKERRWERVRVEERKSQ